MIDFSRVQSIRIPAKLNHGYPFEIITRSQTIYLSASDDKTREVWIEELQHAIRPPYVSDPFGTTKLTAPHLSNLFENEKVISNDSKQSDSSYSTDPNPEQNSIKIKERHIDENRKHYVTDQNANEDFQNNIIEESSKSVTETIVSQNGSVCPDLISECDKKSESNHPVLQNLILSDLNFKNSEEHLDLHNEESSDTNDESNYETAEETLDNEINLDDNPNSNKNDTFNFNDLITNFMNGLETQIVSTNEKLEVSTNEVTDIPNSEK